MGERVIVFSLAAALTLVAGVQDWKLASKKARLAFVLVMLFGCYTGYGYMADNSLPNIHNAVSLAFGQLAKRVDQYLKPQIMPAPPTRKGESEDE